LPSACSCRYHDEMVDDPHTLERLGKRLEEVLASGLSEEPVTHARQVAEVAGILHSALTARGLTPTLVGGSAIEIHAPGIYMSGDLDLVIEGARDVVAVRRLPCSSRSGTIWIWTGSSRSSAGRTHWTRSNRFPA
jgi:hypothetical protein